MNSRYSGALIGFVLGDMFGTQVKDQSRNQLFNRPVTKMNDNAKWSENTSLLLLEIDSIVSKNKIDLNDVMLKMNSYIERGNYSLDYPDDIRSSLRVSIGKYIEEKGDPTLCGSGMIDNNSLVRILPFAIYAHINKFKDTDIIKLVSDVTSITNTSEINIMGTYFLTRFIIFLLNGKDKYSAYNMARSVDYSMFGESTNNLYKDLLNDITKVKLDDLKSSNNVIDTINSVMWVVLNSDNYKSSVIGAVSLGGDNSSIGAITGALYGIIATEDLLPREWTNKIQKKDYILELFNELLENK